MVCCVPTSYDEYIAMVKTGNECQLSASMLVLGKFAVVVCCAEVLFQFPSCRKHVACRVEHRTYHGTGHCTD